MSKMKSNKSKQVKDSSLGHRNFENAEVGNLKKRVAHSEEEAIRIIAEEVKEGEQDKWGVCVVDIDGINDIYYELCYSRKFIGSENLNTVLRIARNEALVLTDGDKFAIAFALVVGVDQGLFARNFVIEAIKSIGLSAEEEKEALSNL